MIDKYDDNIYVVYMKFNENTGYLPEGIHLMGWNDVVRLCGFNAHRKAQLSGLKNALLLLKKAGCRTLYLDGSFVTDKPIPGDYDAAYEIDGIDGDELSRIAPTLLDFSNKREAMKAAYLGELFPSQWDASMGVPFLDFFQTDRDGNPKGLIQINVRDMS